jgi:hypothetical protein
MNLQEGKKCHIYAKIYCFNGFKNPPVSGLFIKKMRRHHSFPISQGNSLIIMSGSAGTICISYVLIPALFVPLRGRFAH